MRTRSATVDTGLAQVQGGGFMVLVEMALDSGTVRMSNTPVDIVWGGNTFTGLGSLGRIDIVRDTETGEVAGLKLTLSGISSTNLSLALGSEAYQGRRVTVYTGVFISPTHTLQDVATDWEATIDTMPITDQPDGTSLITVNCETDLLDWRRAKARCYSDADQQRLFPGDTGCRYTARLAEANLVWPAAAWWQK